MIKSDQRIISKKDGTLLKKYRDLPRYKAIFEYEDEFKKKMGKTLVNMNKQLVEQFIKFL